MVGKWEGMNVDPRLGRLPALVALCLSACVMPMSVGDEPADDGVGSGDSSSTAGPTTASPTDGATSTMDEDTGTAGMESTGTGEPEIPEDCSTYLKDCPEGYKCMPRAIGDTSWNDTECVPVAEDPGGPGDPCTYLGDPLMGIEDCDANSICFYVDPETLMGTCYEMCGNSEQEPTCEDECAVCVITGDGIFSWCEVVCDPLAPSCLPGQVCVPSSNTYDHDFLCVPDASAPGTEIGSSCEATNACPAGMVCLDDAEVPGCTGVRCCSPVCDPEAVVDPCPGMLPGSVCTPWYQPGEGPPAACIGGPSGACMVP